MLAGETADIKAGIKAGYEAGNTVWTVSYMNSEKGLSIKDASLTDTTVTLSSGLLKEDTFVVFASAENEKPEGILSFDSYYLSGYEDNMEEITLDAFMTDTSDLSAYALVRTDGSEPEEPEIWIEAENSLSATCEFTVSEAGTYFLFVKDESGNVTVSDGVKVSEVSFAPNGGTGEMPVLLKVKGYEIKGLPENAYVKTGYGFTQWTAKESGKIYTDCDSFVEDIDEVLIANWSNTIYSYSVNYYLMGLDEEYHEPSKTVTSQAVINTVIDAANDELISSFTGFTFDSSISDSGITVTEEGLAINLYYARNHYTVSYEYT
ncbi:MAG: hypothetical protein MJ171_03855, partial [Clostridia bacterium]|nr:hypothetical protein [Clostridia bacterium]